MLQAEDHIRDVTGVQQKKNKQQKKKKNKKKIKQRERNTRYTSRPRWVAVERERGVE